jgi:hypothetical protein
MQREFTWNCNASVFTEKMLLTLINIWLQPGDCSRSRSTTTFPTEYAVALRS